MKIRRLLSGVGIFIRSSVVLAGFLLQTVPAHGQGFVWAKQMGGLSGDVAEDVVLQQSFCKFVWFHEHFSLSASFHSQSLSVLVCR